MLHACYKCYTDDGTFLSLVEGSSILGDHSFLERFWQGVIVSFFEIYIKYPAVVASVKHCVRGFSSRPSLFITIQMLFGIGNVTNEISLANRFSILSFSLKRYPHHLILHFVKCFQRNNLMSSDNIFHYKLINLYKVSIFVLLYILLHYQ